MERASASDSHGLERLRDGQEVSTTARAGRGTCSHGGHRQESRSPDSPEAVALSKFSANVICSVIFGNR